MYTILGTREVCVKKFKSGLGGGVLVAQSIGIFDNLLGAADEGLVRLFGGGLGFWRNYPGIV